MTHEDFDTFPPDIIALSMFNTQDMLRITNSQIHMY